ncbi:MAG: 3TM-type holin [Betaproteobacteria bacterium]|jgi:hypothetical protein
MADFDWKSLVATVAPTLATALGGPLAGMATKAIATAVLGRDEATEAELAQALAGATPDQLLALKKADADFAVRMKELDLDLEKLAGQNAADVNKTMQAEAASEHWPTYSWRPAIGYAVALAVVLSVLTVFLAYGAVILYGRAEGLQHLPGILAAVAGIIGVVSPILGIASWFRGRMQADPNIPTINRG